MFWAILGSKYGCNAPVGSHARQELKFDAIDVQSQDNLRRRSGIVKSARSSFGSGSTLRGSDM